MMSELKLRPPKEKLPLKEGGNKGKMAASSRRYTARLRFVAEG
jgi:hypothetical protein